MKQDKIALFDLDGTLADYDGQLLKDLQRIASEHEPPPVLYSNIPYLEARRHVITSQVGWFINEQHGQTFACLHFDVLNSHVTHSCPSI